MPAKKAAPAIPAAKLARYERLVATLPGVERKGATVPYTSVAGKMASYLTPAGVLVFRLPAGEREAYMKKFGVKPHVQYGTLMKDWVTVPEKLFAQPTVVRRYLARAHEHAHELGAKRR